MPGRLRVGIDARYLSHGLVGGVHTYVRALVSAVIAADEVDLTLWTDTKAPLDLPELPKRVHVQQLPWTSAVSSIRNDILMKRVVAVSGVDVAHFPANYGCAPPWVPTIITLHDAINLYPMLRIWRTHPKRPKMLLTMTYLHLMTVRAIARQPHVVTVSQYSRQEILRVARLDASHITVVPSAHDPAFHRLSDSELAVTRERLHLSGHVVVADAIKNAGCTLRAWQAIPGDLRERSTLVFFARREPPSDVRRAAERGECQLLLRPERAELVRLFNVADVFLFPSWYEGFGLPVLEAMACGAPVIVSDRGSLPEVVGDAGIVLDAEDHVGFAGEIAALLLDSQHRARMSQRSLIRASSFSWERTAAATVALYQQIAGQRTSRRQALPHPLAAG